MALKSCVCDCVKSGRFRLREFRDFIRAFRHLRIRQTKAGAYILEYRVRRFVAENKGVFVVCEINPVVIGLECELLFLRLSLPHYDTSEQFNAVVTEYTLVALFDINSCPRVVVLVVVEQGCFEVAGGRAFPPAPLDLDNEVAYVIALRPFYKNEADFCHSAPPTSTATLDRGKSNSDF